MRRRELISLLGGAAAWSLTARAQQQAMPVIGYLGGTSPEQSVDRLRAFRQGLNEAGVVEGSDATIEFRWAHSHFDRLPAIVADLVRHRVAVIAIPGSTQGAVAAKAATAVIPIVFGIAGDPVEIGLVSSLNRPGGNLTGITLWNAELVPKRMELLHELVTKRNNIALLVNPTSPVVAEADARAAQAAARALGLQLQVLNASTAGEIDAGITGLAQRGDSALLIGSDIFLFDNRAQVIALAARNSIPAIYDRREYSAAGGLMSYGADLFDLHRQVGIYVGRILKGQKSAELPVLRPAKYEMVLNMSTAKALGLKVPLHLQQLADEVIE